MIVGNGRTVLKELDVEATKEFIRNQSPETKVYIGADSEKLKINGKWYADYTCSVVVHIDGCHGCKVFGKTVRMPDYDIKKGAPKMRMMNETYLVAEVFLDLAEVLVDQREFELHLDINPDIKHGSSCAVKEAVSYIRGVCNVVPMVKPNAQAASF